MQKGNYLRKISIIGTQNSGKTTSLYYLSYKLKKIGKLIGVGHEVARECPYPLNEAGGMLTQLWILSKQMEREAQLEKHYDRIILDRSIYDTIPYCDYLSRKGIMTKEDSEFFKETSFKWGKIHPYYLLIYLEPLSLDADPQRGKNVIEYQREIERNFKSLIKRVPSKVIVLKKAPKEERCKEVYRIVNEAFYG